VTDILIIGGGVAGLSAGAMLSPHAKVTVLEAEESVGYHSSGRSATMMHYALGNPLVRALTLASRPFIEQPPQGFSDVPLGHGMPTLVHAREEELPALDELNALIAPFAKLDRVDERGILDLCPILRVGEGGSIAALVDPNALRLDTDALLQGYARTLRHNGGALVTGTRVAGIDRNDGSWDVKTDRGERFSASAIVNAAGSWADKVAEMAEVSPLGLQPKRRTIITFDAPAGSNSASWPFVKTVGDELYFAPESGRLFASPMDEVPSEPTDAQPDDFEVALAAWRMEERTTVKVERIHSKWAGLRTFTPDGRPAVGFARDAEGFFWLAGQGGFGLQTSPAMARIVESLVAGTPWPFAEVSPDELSPIRFARQPA
jgi:D-arginine dehydrogenase